MPKIIVQTSYHDFEDQEIEELVNSLTDIPQGIQIMYDKEQMMRKGSYGVTWWQVVKMYLEEIPADIRAAVVTYLLGQGAVWIKSVFKKRKNKRPKMIKIYDENSSELGNIVLGGASEKTRSYDEFNKWREKKDNTKKKKSKKRRK